MRLNLGCGGQLAEPPWVNVDRAGPNVTLVDITKEWPWPPNTVDGIVSHHVLDLLSPDEMFEVLQLCRDSLDLGCVLRVSFADLTEGVHRALAGDALWFAEAKPSLEETLGFFVTQGGARRQFLEPAELCDEMKAAGFAHAYPAGFGRTLGPQWLVELDSRREESVFVEAIR